MPLKKIVRKARKFVKKIIPKEIRPFAPYIAAGFIPGGALGLGSLSPALQKAIIAGGTKFATDDEASLKDVGITAALAASPDLIKQGSSSLAGKLDPKLAADIAGNIDEASSLKEATGITAKLASGLSKVGQTMPTLGETGSTLGTQAKLVGGLGAVDATRKLAEIQQDELDAYNRKLAEQGITDKSQRRRAIRDIYLGVGYGEDYVDSMLDRYGYKGGGMTMTDEQFATLLNSLKDDEDEDEMSIREYTDMANKGFQQAYGMESLFDQAPKPMPIRPGFDEGGDIMSPEEYFKEKEKFQKRKSIDDMMREYEDYMYKQKYGPRDSAAEGGLMNLGGKEMDLRGGGFVPIGKKEKADDVPARLSKNEFVMTADAVRGAGGGDVNEGARRMYQTMDKLEAMA